MKWADIDWSIIGASLAVFLLTLGFSLALLRNSMQFREVNDQEYQTQHARFLMVSSKYLAVDDDRRILTDLYPRFVDLTKKGIIGQEQRLNWYEVLHRLGEDIILGLNYKISSREPYQPVYPLPHSAFQVNSSAMKLDMDLLHEKDLATVLNALRREAAGLFSVERCELQPLTITANSPKLTPNLRAQCDMRWFTLTLANGREVSLP